MVVVVWVWRLVVWVWMMAVRGKADEGAFLVEKRLWIPVKSAVVQWEVALVAVVVEAVDVDFLVIEVILKGVWRP